jgi:hypothetical protein
VTLPDAHGSRAVLIGVHAYAHLDSLPGVRGGVRTLAGLLRDRRVWGLPARHVTVVPADASADDVLTAVRDAGRAATDTLLVYFAGHGLRDRVGGQLYLALADADEDHLEVGTLPYPALRRVVAQAGCRTRRRITVLDCCYSGLAIGVGGDTVPLDRPGPVSPLGEQAHREGESHAEQAVAAEGGRDAERDGGNAGGEDDEAGYGSCVLTSASSTERCFTRPGHAPDFTGALIDVLRHGIPAAGPTLSLDRIWCQAGRRLVRRGCPQPQQFGHDSVTGQPWLHNRAHTASRSGAPPRRSPGGAPDATGPLRADGAVGRTRP